MTSPGAINFTIDGLPIAKGRPRAVKVGNFIRHHTPEKTANYESWVRGCARAAMDGRELLLCPVTLQLHFYLPVPTSWPAWRKEAALQGFVAPTGRPDIDNLVKSIKDACNMIVWKDDSQVVELSATKLYGEQPSALVNVLPLGEITSAVEWKENLRRRGFTPSGPGDLFGSAA